MTDEWMLFRPLKVHDGLYKHIMVDRQMLKCGYVLGNGAEQKDHRWWWAGNESMGTIGIHAGWQMMFFFILSHHTQSLEPLSREGYTHSHTST